MQIGVEFEFPIRFVQLYVDISISIDNTPLKAHCNLIDDSYHIQ